MSLGAVSSQADTLVSCISCMSLRSCIFSLFKQLLKSKLLQELYET